MRGGEDQCHKDHASDLVPGPGLRLSRIRTMVSQCGQCREQDPIMCPTEELSNPQTGAAGGSTASTRR